MSDSNKNIFAMIEDMRKKGENATTEDLWNVIEEMQKGHDDYQQKKDAEVEALNKTIAEIIEKATKEKDDHLINKPPQKNGRFLMAAMRNDMLDIEKYGGRFSRKGDPWDDKDDWNKFIGMSDAQQKAALGTVLRGENIAPLTGNSGMECSQIRGNLSLVDMAIPSQAHMGRCRDLTGAILKECA